jgi:hypothetical protein
MPILLFAATHLANSLVIAMRRKRLLVVVRLVQVSRRRWRAERFGRAARCGGYWCSHLSGELLVDSIEVQLSVVVACARLREDLGWRRRGKWGEALMLEPRRLWRLTVVRVRDVRGLDA